MKKLIVSMIALAAVSTTAYAENRSQDLRDMDTYMGKFADEGVVAEPFAIPEVPSDEWLFADGEYVKDPNEVRRFEEKNK
jgi:hypothetical protein